MTVLLYRKQIYQPNAALSNSKSISRSSLGLHWALDMIDGLPEKFSKIGGM